MYWEMEQLNLDLFKNNQLSYAADSLQYSLELLAHQEIWLEQEVPYQADLGMLRIDNAALKEKLVPVPSGVLARLRSFMPQLLRERMREVKSWLSASTAQLKTDARTIDSFVQQQQFMKEIEKKYAS